MLKIKIDTQATLGNDFILIDSTSWNDYQDKSKILGTKLTCGALDKFEKFTVKIPKNEIHIENGQKIQFTNLQATAYSNGRFVNLSFKADDVQEVQTDKETLLK